MAVLLLLGASAMIARADRPGTLHRLVADFQNSTSVGPAGEISSNIAPGPLGTGGFVTYSKIVSIPDNTVFITFSGQGDSHFGTALLMTASVTDSTGTETVCQPLQGQTDIGGGGIHLQTGWYTLLHLPDAGLANVTNCNDGGGGAADCHDNNLYFSCCLPVTPDSGKGGSDIPEKSKSPKTHTIKIRLANSTGGGTNLSFYERATIYVDSASSSSKNPLCTGVGIPTP